MKHRTWIKGAGISLFLIALLVLFAFDGHALEARFSVNSETETYVATNTDYIAYGETNVSTSTIVAGRHRLLGFVCLPYDTTLASELVVSLHDAANTITAANLFDEAEWDPDWNKTPMWYPYPKAITTQLTLWQGPNTTVIVYYEDTLKF